MALDQFKRSHAGELIQPLLDSPDAVQRMMAFSRRDRPALEAIGSEIAERVGTLTDNERKDLGRWVREILGRFGWVPNRKGRVAPGNLFSRGTIYRQREPSSRGGAGSRLAKAQGLLQQRPDKAMSADEFVAMRHRAFNSGE